MKPGTVVFLGGKKVYLRPLNAATDLALCQRWINDPQTRPFIGSGSIPVSAEREKQFFEETEDRKFPRNIIMGIVVKATGKMIGTMGLHDINWIDRSATTGALIGDKTNRSRGYGTEAKELLLEYAFNTLNLHRINSQALSYNDASRRYSEKCGYRLEGRLRQAIYKNGRYHDLIQLGLLKSDWQKRKSQLAKGNKKKRST
jgi:RimJ/RimL family protein N-acetyltransferase